MVHPNFFGELKRRNVCSVAARNLSSGERTRLACWLRRLAETIFFSLQGEKSAIARRAEAAGSYPQSRRYANIKI